MLSSGRCILCPAQQYKRKSPSSWPQENWLETYFQTMPARFSSEVRTTSAGTLKNEMLHCTRRKKSNFEHYVMGILPVWNIISSLHCESCELQTDATRNINKNQIKWNSVPVFTVHRHHHHHHYRSFCTPAKNRSDPKSREKNKSRMPPCMQRTDKPSQTKHRFQKSMA